MSGISLDKKFELITYDTKYKVESIIYARANNEAELLKCLEKAAMELSLSLEYEADRQVIKKGKLKT